MDKSVKQALFKAKSYMVYTWIFLIGGFAVFALLYGKYVEGRFMEAIQEPHLIVVFLLPFLPAVVLSLMTKKNYRVYEDLLSKEGGKSGDKP